MTLGEFFWLDDAKFAQRLSRAKTNELMLDDKHNVRKRKGGKLGAWVGAAQAPHTLGISLFGTAIGARNRHVAKRRLEMIHAELERRGQQKHAEDWKDNAFALIGVGAGAVAGMGFVPGADVAAQGFAEAGATHAAAYATQVATTELYSNIGSSATEILTANYTDPDTYFNRSKEMEAGMGYFTQPPYYSTSYQSTPYTPAYTPSPTPSPMPPNMPMQYMPIPPAPNYG